jgi:signal transduction histidine kinase/integral membrane sensor domain MASE1/ActR/RegA family two-component response regulator
MTAPAAAQVATPRARTRKFDWSDAAAAACVAATYFLCAKLGLSMAYGARHVTLVWPSAGIALAAVFLLGRRVAPGVAVGAFLANVTTAEPVAAALCIACGNTAEAVVGAWLLDRLGVDAALGRIRDVIAMIGSAFGPPAIAAVVGAASLCLADVHPWEEFRRLAATWWIGDAVGALVVAPPLLVMTTVRLRAPPVRGILEFLALAACFAAVAWSMYRFGAVKYLLFPLVAWTALRLGQRGTTPLILASASLAVWATVRGIGPFAGGTVPAGLLLLQLYVGVMALTGLLLGAACATRERAERRLRADYEVGRILASSESLESAAPRILRAVCVTLRWDLGAVWRIDADARALRCVELWRAEPRSPSEFERVTRERAFASGEGLPGRVWKTARPAWVPDIAQDVNFPRAPFAAQERLHAAFGFPITSGGEVVALMEFFSRRIRRPDAELLEMMGDVGGRIGQFIERRAARDAVLASEERHRRLAERLQEEDRRKDEFLATLSHELRNPLAPISNALQILRLAERDPSLREEALATADRQLRAMVRLVDDLMDVSRITRGEVPLRRERTTLAELVSRAVETSRPLIGALGHELTVELSTEEIGLDVDPTRIAQVLSNLLNNAAKYSDRGGRVRVAARVAEDGGVAISVRDSGIGVAPRDLARIFEPFMQVDRSLERSRGGLGVGLTLVRRLVESHGGSVTARSDGLGRGSEFTVRLPPSARCAAPAAPAAASPARTAGVAARRILVVDDNRDAATTLAALLRRKGDDVRLAFDGREAIEAAAEFQPQIVLLDIGLPAMNGFEVARHIRRTAAGASAVLVALTGWSQEEDRRRSREAGFDHHLVKPVDHPTLERLLASIESEAADT